MNEKVVQIPEIPLRKPTKAERSVLARIAGCEVIGLKDDGISFKVWDPLTSDAHALKLLAAIIKQKDCRLLYDDGVDEYFIYQYTPEHSPPVAHRKVLNEVILEAALELWFPK